MRDRENVLGQCMGDEVKNFGKDIREMQSGEYGIFCVGLNAELLGIRRKPVG